MVLRAMKRGYYEGVNLEKNYCSDCGHEFETNNGDDIICPTCGSTNITQINRVCGYLGFSKIKGDTRCNDSKLAEMKDRVSM